MMEHHQVESEFLQPIMTSPQESKRIAVSAKHMEARLFVCSLNKKELDGTAALKYIQWGESEGFHERASVMSRKPWYNLGNLRTAPILLSKMNDTTVRTFLTDTMRSTEPMSLL